nr:hypothetical protein [Tanacetum cinerariifolium]
MGDEHLSTIPKTKLDKVIKSSVEILVSIPSELEDTSDNDSECDVLVNDESSLIFTTFSNPLFDCNNDFTSSNDKTLSNEEIPMEIFKNYSNSLFDDEEIISTKIDPRFSGKLAHIDPIPSGIEEADFDLEEEICLVENLFDSFMEEIDLSFTPEDPMPPGIEEDDYDSERDMLIFEEFLSNDSLSLSENESFHFDIPSFPRPLVKPLDDDSGILTVKMVSDISKHDVPMPKLLPTQPTLVSNQEKSPDLLSYRG